MNDHAKLVEKFVASFEFVADEMTAHEILNPIAWQLANGRADEYGGKPRRPRKERTDPFGIAAAIPKAAARFPPLYEELILPFRWADVDLQVFTLLANQPGNGLELLFRKISGDKGLWETLIANGYIPFGKGATAITTRCASLSNRGRIAHREDRPRRDSLQLPHQGRFPSGAEFSRTGAAND